MLGTDNITIIKQSNATDCHLYQNSCYQQNLREQNIYILQYRYTYTDS